MNQHEELARGEAARLILESETYQESYQSVREALIGAWEQAPLRDKDGANELKLMLKLLGDVRKNMEAALTTGKMAKITIERTPMERARRLVSI